MMPGRHREPLLDFGLDHDRETDVRDAGDTRTGEITGGKPFKCRTAAGGPRFLRLSVSRENSIS
jgi:hypothetical protein